MAKTVVQIDNLIAIINIFNYHNSYKEVLRTDELKLKLTHFKILFLNKITIVYNFFIST